MAEMTHCERVFRALELGQPDRVPLFETVIDEKVIQGVCPGGDYYEFNDRIGLDVVGLNRSSWPKERITFIDAERRLFKDHWGVVRGVGTESSPYPVEPAIKSRADLERYSPPDPDDPAILGHLHEVVARYKGVKPIIWTGRDAYFDPAHLRGVEDFLMDFIRDPEFAHEVIDLCLEFDLRLTRNAIAAGVDIVVLGDDYADNRGPMMSPEHFREFILPGLRRAIADAHDAGAYVVKHSDGYIWPILDMIVDAGPDAINPIEPAAGMDIGAVKAAYGHRVCLIGNIDCGRLLSHGTPEEVRRAVRECIAAAGPGGGFILASSNSIHSSVRPENYVAMAEACREFGSYPLSL
jgi:uroporphyrinogen decarboxylase